MKVYIAGKTHHATFFARAAQIMSPQVQCTSRWIDYVLDGQEETPENARKFWVEDQEDVAEADVVLVWAAPGDTLRGALVEVGMGIAYGKRIIAVGYGPEYSGTWHYHPAVHRVERMSHAFELLLEWSRASKR